MSACECDVVGCVVDAGNQLGTESIARIRDLLSTSNQLPQLQSLRLLSYVLMYVRRSPSVLVPSVL